MPKYLEGIRRELDDVWADEVPRPTEWQEFDIQEAHRRLAGRLAAKVFVGHPACRDPEWIRVSVGFSMDVFKTGLLLRMFPPLLHPIIARLLPSRRAVLDDLEIAKRTLGPLMDKHREHVAAKARGEEVEEEEDILLHWMMDHATDEENKLDNMAVRNLFITLAAVHTTSMSATHMLFDLCAHPEWLDVMRDEISQVKRELGPLGSSPEAAPKHWLARLEKMDSLFVESQRMNLPSLCKLETPFPDLPKRKTNKEKHTNAHTHWQVLTIPSRTPENRHRGLHAQGRHRHPQGRQNHMGRA